MRSHYGARRGVSGISPRLAGIAFTFVSILGLIPWLALADDGETPSALERDSHGWTDLLAQAGAKLEGWTRGTIPPGRPLNPRSQWSIDAATGHLVCDGNGGHEWLRWDKEIGDGIFHVEWRFTPLTGKRGYNSGIYARNSADARIWHQAQTGSGSGGYLFGETEVDGKLKRINLSRQQKGSRVKPAGDWNTFEITCKGKDMTLWVNGAVTNHWDNCQVSKGYVGLEAEGYRIEFRNVKLKSLDGASEVKAKEEKAHLEEIDEEVLDRLHSRDRQGRRVAQPAVILDRDLNGPAGTQDAGHRADDGLVSSSRLPQLLQVVIQQRLILGCGIDMRRRRGQQARIDQTAAFEEDIFQRTLSLVIRQDEGSVPWGGCGKGSGIIGKREVLRA